MVAILVAMAVMAIMATVAVQTASFQKKRENEEELIFRGNQIVEGIRLFRARHGRFPVVLEELAKANPKVLRQAWKDPVTGKTDWVPVFLGQDGQAITPQGGAQGEGAARLGPTPGPDGKVPMPATDARGPIVGVHSRSCDESIKVLDGRTRYCEWKFVLQVGGPGLAGGRGDQPPVRDPGGGRPRPQVPGR